MKILLISNPLFGHLNPLLSLAAAARDGGHDVIVATSPDMAPRVQRDGIAAWPVGMTHEAGGGNVQASWLAYFEAAARARLPGLLSRCRHWHPDLVIHEETELAGPTVAALLGTRAVVHGLGPLPAAQVMAWAMAALERIAPPGVGARVVETWRGATYVHPCPPALRGREPPIWPRALAYRPTTPDAGDGPSMARRIDALPHRRTVFLTLGTVFGGNAQVLHAALTGLRDLETNVVVALGPQGDPSKFSDDGGHVIVATYVPLASVLARCTAVVSQGGSGVMLGALAFGLPQLLLPQGADQFRNAELCTPTGAALTLQPPAATPRAIADGVRRLLEEPSFAAVAQRVQAEIAAMPGAHDAVRALCAANPGLAEAAA